jgi:hypothetical protein
VRSFPHRLCRWSYPLILTTCSDAVLMRFRRLQLGRQGQPIRTGHVDRTAFQLQAQRHFYRHRRQRGRHGKVTLFPLVSCALLQTRPRPDLPCTRCSNSLLLEKCLNWRGICVEPGVREFAMLSKPGLRSCAVFNAAASNTDGYADFCEAVQGALLLPLNPHVRALQMLRAPSAASLTKCERRRACGHCSVCHA